MSDVHNHEHAKENKGVGPASSLRTVIGVIVSIIAVCLVMFAIFRVYSNELSDEFYDLASVSMDDYTAAQKVEVESFISEVSSRQSRRARGRRAAQHRESGEASGYEPGELAGYAARHAADQRGRNRRSRVEGIRRL